ncbi:hypothetical protein B0H13DRAFT_1907319 [Mycena leptocephala]|nr:hypothetical protein B0H13DRAFT_1907319 [Mycena leptocephala]
MSPTRKLSLKLKKITNSVFHIPTPSQAILKPDKTPSSDISSPTGKSCQKPNDFIVTRSNSPPTSTPSTPTVSQILMSVYPEEPGSSGWKVFMQGLGVVKDVSEITDARNELGAMAQRMTALASLLRRYEGRTDDEDIRNRLEGMTEFVLFPLTPFLTSNNKIRAISHQRSMIEKKLALGMRNIIANSPDAHDVIQCIRAITFLNNIFEVWELINTFPRFNCWRQRRTPL